MDHPAEPSPKNPLVWLREFATSKRGRAFVLIVVLVLVFGAAIWAAYARYFAADGTGSSAGPSLPGLSLNDGPAKKPALLTGLMVEEDLAQRRPLAVMIENHPDARPQSGLVDADLVYEVIVEGGITRFMAIYGSRDAEKIGPVRSARLFYIHWAAGLHALYAHAGGSQGALALLPTIKEIVDLPHTAAYFQREPKPGVASEHTLFSGTKQLYDFAREKDAKLKADIDEYKFVDDFKSEKRPDSATVGINFSSPSYQATWEYERESNSYKRSLAGVAHVDRRSGDQIIAKNIAVIEVNRSYNPNTNQGKGEWSMTTEGTGQAKLFQNGTMIEGTWKKPGVGDMLKLFDGNGRELTFVKGQTWFEVVPPGVSVTHEEKAATPPASKQ